MVGVGESERDLFVVGKVVGTCMWSICSGKVVSKVVGLWSVCGWCATGVGESERILFVVESRQFLQPCVCTSE